MANMAIFSENLLNTTTQIVVTSNTATTEYLFDRDLNSGYETAGQTSDTACVISVELPAGTVISNLFLQGHNFKDFSVSYDSLTANTLYVGAGVSDSSSYISFSSITVSSIQIQVDAPQTADTERYLKELVVCEKKIDFERNPSFKQYKPKVYRKDVRHEMADGGVSMFVIRDRYRSTLQLDFATTSFKSSLKSLYDEASSFYFTPFPTTTAWDGDAFSVVWSNDFDFKHSTNDKQQGFDGTITLEQTSSQ